MERISCYILALLIFAFVALTNTSCTNTTDAKPAITSSAITDTAETAAEPDRLDELGKKNLTGVCLQSLTQMTIPTCTSIFRANL